MTDVPIRADLQVRETKINVPENAEIGTHKYIRYETIDIYHKMNIFALNNEFFKALRFCFGI